MSAGLRRLPINIAIGAEISAAFSRPPSLDLALSPSDTLFRELLESHNLSNRRIIFTDGSKNPSQGRVGCAVFSSVPRIILKYNLSEFNSVFEAEAFAILHALRAISEVQHMKSFVIASDSLSIITTLNNIDPFGKNHPLIYLIKDIYNSLLLQEYDILFLWIPGHRGICGNESVDALAKEAADDYETTAPHDKITFTFTLRSVLLNNIMEKAYEFFENSSKERGFRYFHRTRIKLLAPWFKKKLNLSKKIITLISRMRSFHIRTAEHLFEKNIVPSPLCDCGSVESLLHVLFECASHSEASDRLRIGLFRACVDWPVDVEDIAFLDNDLVYKELEMFLHSVKKLL